MTKRKVFGSKQDRNHSGHRDCYRMDSAQFYRFWTESRAVRVEGRQIQRATMF